MNQDIPKLYSFIPQDRSGKIRWLLEELGVTYEIRNLDGENQENETQDYLKIHPMGMVPVLEDNGTVIFESGAICIYLTERFASRGLAPSASSPHRGEFLTWTFFATATLDPLLIRVFEAKKLPSQEGDKLLREIKETFAPVAKKLESALADSPYLIGGEFSAADIMIAQPLNWADRVRLLDDYPVLSRYLERLRARPACKKAGLFLV